MQIKSKGGKYKLDVYIPLAGENEYGIAVTSEDKNSQLHVDFDVSPTAFENFIADSIGHLGLTKRIQKALKPLLVDEAHAQGVHS